MRHILLKQGNRPHWPLRALAQQAPRSRGRSRANSDPGDGLEIPNHPVRFAIRKALSQSDNIHPPYGAAIPDSNLHIPPNGALIPLNGNRNPDNGNRIPANDNPIPVNDKKFT